MKRNPLFYRSYVGQTRPWGNIFRPGRPEGSAGLLVRSRSAPQGSHQRSRYNADKDENRRGHGRFFAEMLQGKKPVHVPLKATIGPGQRYAATWNKTTHTPKYFV